MSLFAAYSNLNKNENINDVPKTTEDWLTNSSFKIDVNPTPEPRNQVSDDHVSSNITKATKKRKKEKKVKREKERKHKREKVETVDEDFVIDKKRTPEYLTVRTISRPVVAKYRIQSWICDGQKKFKRSKFKRYYEIVVEKHVNESDSDREEIITEKDLVKNVNKEINVDFKGFQQEEDMSKMTAYYNKMLGDEPDNIELWIKYIHFQDQVFQFEKTYRKGSIAKGLRVTAERKLSIVDKALLHNPNCEELHRLRLNIAVTAFPADELQSQLKKLVEKEKENIILWQGYIEATQCSMSHCNTTGVINLYIRCLHTLHTLRRAAKLEKAQLEENILRMLYQCGLFLKQAGLFEQLWTLLRLYLELNLSPSNESKFNINMLCNEKQLIELEEVVLKSQLPIYELWLRVEKLREACHWLPINAEECEDPQRIVFTDDVSDLIHPITMPGNTIKLTVTILNLLKIPLLPNRHTTMQMFGIDYVPWSLDSIETLLPIFFPIYPIDLSNNIFLKYTQKLTVGPQYLRNLPGQEEYLQFILTIMKNSIESLEGLEQTALTIWWFQFQRLLIVLEKKGIFSISNAFKKRLKSEIKNMLKEHTSNVLLFKEYALFERDGGNRSNSKSILLTALKMSYVNTEGAQNFIINVNIDRHQRAAVLSTFRSLIELHIEDMSDANEGQAKSKEVHANEIKQKCLKYFVAFVHGRSLDNLSTITTLSLTQAKNSFTQTTDDLLSDLNSNVIQSEEHFLPDFTTDWIICHYWFLYLNDSFDEALELLEKSVSSFEDNSKSLRNEILYEFMVAALFKQCLEIPGCGLFPKLDLHLQKAVASYPNNLFLLSALSKLQSMHFCLGQPWWKVQSMLLKTGHALPSVFLILIMYQRMAEIEDGWMDTITGQTISPEFTFKTKLLSLFKRLTKNDMCTRRCGLVWRLYLQFLHAYSDPKTLRNVYYAAVEECPWLKALYIDAAIYIPEELSQIQDLIIEKQLRIHVTPEELDVLRN